VGQFSRREMFPFTTLLVRLLNFQMSENNDCYEWQGNFNASGYGQMKYFGKNVLAHRVLMEIFLGRRLPKNILVCHHCDNPACINLEHLFLGTHKDNALDMVAKGRGNSQKKTHCPLGHEYTKENTYILNASSGKERRCKTCLARKEREKRAKKKALLAAKEGGI
jgi:hypothetical protein